MKKIIIYSYIKCSTCRKALKWIEQKDIKYQLVDIVQKPPLAGHLELALKQYSLDKRKIFNVRGNSYKSINFDVLTLNNEEIIKLFQSDGKLIKRPFLVFKEKNIILGFNENEYTDNLL